MKNLLMCIIVIVFFVSQTGCVGFSVVHGQFETPSPALSDKDQVLQERGAPARTFHKDGREYWVYPTKGQWAWRGIVFDRHYHGAAHGSRRVRSDGTRI